MVETTVLNGLVGGLIATIVMTVLMMVLGDDSPPPTAQFWSEYIGDDAPESYLFQGMALHFIYGIGAGVGLAVILYGADVGVADLFTGVALGLGYGFVLFVFAAVFWMNLILDMDPEPKDIGLFLFFHLVYGGVLGAVLAAGII